jgi:hypothetical protein
MGVAEYAEAKRIINHHNGEIDEMFRILRKADGANHQKK